MALLSTTVKAILANKLYVPVHVWNSLSKEVKSDIKALFIQRTHNPFLCFINTTGKKCEAKERMVAIGRKPIVACFSCKKSEQVYACMSKSSKYVKFDVGNQEAINDLLSILKKNGVILDIEDRRTCPKLKGKWDMKYEKMDPEKSTEQIRMADIWCAEKNGILICPPRFGKSLMTAFIGQKMKTRILILVHKIDLARQFYKDWTTFTTIPKNKISINPKTVDEFESNYVSICTYQQFLHGDRLKLVRKLFGLIIVDEVHKAAADKFSQVISSFYARYRLGVTATAKRRDDKDFKNEHVFGPILAEGGAEQLQCEYIFTETDWNCKYKLNSDKGWDALWSALSKDKNRNGLIADMAIADVLAGHKIIIPIKRHIHMENLYKLIKNKADKEGLSIKICQYHGKLDPNKRKELQEKIYKGKYDIVIGTDSIVSLGFNAPPLSCVYINVHSYRRFKPDLYQEYSRVRTKCKSKKITPLIRIFKDKGNEVVDSSMEIIEAEMRSKGFIERQDKISNKEKKEVRSKRGLKKVL